MPTIKIIHDETHPERADENAALAAAVSLELTETVADGCAYATFRSADGAFFHIVAYETAADNERFTNLPSFARFVEHGADRWKAHPVITEVTLVGNYRFMPSG